MFREALIRVCKTDDVRQLSCLQTEHKISFNQIHSIQTHDRSTRESRKSRDICDIQQYGKSRYGTTRKFNNIFKSRYRTFQLEFIPAITRIACSQESALLLSVRQIRLVFKDRSTSSHKAFNPVTAVMVGVLPSDLCPGLLSCWTILPTRLSCFFFYFYFFWEGSEGGGGSIRREECKLYIEWLQW